MTVAQERALEYSMLITACNKNDRPIMHRQIGNLIYMEKKNRFTDKLLEHLDKDFEDVAKKDTKPS